MASKANKPDAYTVIGRIGIVSQGAIAEDDLSFRRAGVEETGTAGMVWVIDEADVLDVETRLVGDESHNVAMLEGNGGLGYLCHGEIVCGLGGELPLDLPNGGEELCIGQLRIVLGIG